MFNNIGQKIKTLAAVICWIGIIISVIGGIAVWVAIDDEIGALAFLGIAVVGSLLSWIGSFFTYGFGELICKVSAIEAVVNTGNTVIEENVSDIAKTPLRQGDKTAWESKENKVLGNCELCGKTEVLVGEVKIVDNLGVRYRNVCKECFEENN